MAIKPMTVEQLNEYVSRVLGTDPLLMNMRVVGEVFNVNYHQSGHVYFSLQDEHALVNCAIWKSSVPNIGFELKDGQKIIVTGRISCYKPKGTYSISVTSVELLGNGGLAEAFEQMKEKLEKEGLFDVDHKKDLPFFPLKIAVVTAEKGAAVKDILKIIKSRNDVVSVDIYPAKVQGEGSAENIADIINMINRDPRGADIIIEGRGGGSAEDLASFNEEVLARAIYDSNIPVISAVGHEIDTTISDLVADVRAATPTQAGEISVPDTSELRERLSRYKSEMLRELENNCGFKRMKLQSIRSEIINKLSASSAASRSRLESAKLIIESNDPKRVLSKGYSIVSDHQGKIITDPRVLTDGEELTITMAKGNAKAKFVKED